MTLDPVTLGLAFSAGAATFFSPCAVGLLPGYLGFYLGTDDKVRGDWRLDLAKGVLLGATATAAFLVVFGLAGLMAGALSMFLVPSLPWISLAIGAGIGLLGISMLLGRAWSPRIPVHAPKAKGFGSLFLFGGAYALVSLGCTFPIFLGTVLLAFGEADFGGAFLTVLVYGMGMGVVMIGVTAALSLVGGGLRARLASWAPKVQAVAAILMTAAGAWLVYYWLDFLYDLPGTAPDPFR